VDVRVWREYPLGGVKGVESDEEEGEGVTEVEEERD
jgi:hypothetical protein